MSPDLESNQQLRYVPWLEIQLQPFDAQGGAPTTWATGQVSAGFWLALHKIHELILGELSFLQYFSFPTQNGISLPFFVFVSLSKGLSFSIYMHILFILCEITSLFWMLFWLILNHPNCHVLVCATGQSCIPWSYSYPFTLNFTVSVSVPS